MNTKYYVTTCDKSICLLAPNAFAAAVLAFRRLFSRADIVDELYNNLTKDVIVSERGFAAHKDDKVFQLKDVFEQVTLENESNNEYKAALVRKESINEYGVWAMYFFDKNNNELGHMYRGKRGYEVYARIGEDTYNTYVKTPDEAEDWLLGLYSGIKK